MSGLFDEPESDLDRRFAEFDAAHPEMWRLYVGFAFDLKARKDRGSSEQIIQRIRWECDVNPEHDGGFKVSNIWRKRYAKKMVAEYPQFDGFFQFRESD